MGFFNNTKMHINQVSLFQKDTCMNYVVHFYKSPHVDL
jgi:hypothetical protein